MFWQLIFLIAFVFVITYDPKSGTLDHLVGKKPENLLRMQSVKKGITRKYNLEKWGTRVQQKKQRTWVRL